jgi:hypothetical protein
MAARGRVAVTVVPQPGREWTCQLPPAISSCWRMLARPKWLSPRWPAIGSAAWAVTKPVPSSATWRMTRPWPTWRTTRAWRALACLDDVGEGLLGDPVQHRLLGSGQPAREVAVDAAGDPGLLLEALDVVAEGRRPPPLVQGRRAQLDHDPPQGGDLAGEAVEAGQHQPEQHHRADRGHQALGVAAAGQLDHLDGRGQQRRRRQQAQPPAAEPDLPRRGRLGQGPHGGMQGGRAPAGVPGHPAEVDGAAGVVAAGQLDPAVEGVGDQQPADPAAQDPEGRRAGTAVD